MKRQEPSKAYLIFKSIPVFGSIFAIANAYAYKGIALSNVQIAPLKLWWARIIRKATFIGALVWLLLEFAPNKTLPTDWQPADTILGAYPSILGFGIGVYALMFIMPSDFLSFLKKSSQKSGQKNNIGPEIVPVDMGFPLITYVFIMLIASISKIYPDIIILKLISLWALFYGLAMTVELVSFLFLTSRIIQHIRSKDNDAE